jgi:hypothetical protein
MAKGQKKSKREAKKPKKSTEKPSAATDTPLFPGKGFGTSYKDRYAKTTSK